jgi:uncharacterized protein (TIRG00374 family)
MDQIQEELTIQRGIESRRRFAAAFILIVVFAGVVLVIVDWSHLAPVVRQMDWKTLPGAFLLTFLSYFCVSYAFAAVSRMLGIRMRSRDLAEIGFVSEILNHVLTTGGVAGYSVRYFLMSRHGVSMRDFLAASILHFYLTSLDMLAMLPVGFLYLLLNTSLPPGIAKLLGLMTLLMGTIFIVSTILIFLDSKRTPFLKFAAALVKKAVGRDLSETLQRFDDTMARGVAVMRKKPATILWIMALTWIDWFSSVAVVWFCFDAFGEPVPVGVILTGYVIGVMAGVLSMVPGGFGVQEGSMAGVFVLLGAPFEQAILASVLFRGIFFLAPYLVSLGFYGRLLRKK